MRGDGLFTPWVARFLRVYRCRERKLSRNTHNSYRETLALLLQFVSRRAGLKIARLSFNDLAPATVQAFLNHLEQERGCSVATRNHRLSVMQSLALFLSMQGVDPEWCSAIRAIACKKVPAGQQADYLETAELEALLRAPNPRSRFGLRDRTLLLLLYNTGARAADVARLKIGHLQWDPSPSVRIAGVGTQSQTCPLWPATVALLRPLVADRSSTDPIFRCRNGKAMSRFGIYAAVVAHARRASRQQPSMAGKRISPHTLRNTTRLYLARAGADSHGVQTTPETLSGDEHRVAGSA